MFRDECGVNPALFSLSQFRIAGHIVGGVCMEVENNAAGGYSSAKASLTRFPSKLSSAIR